MLFILDRDSFKFLFKDYLSVFFVRCNLNIPQQSAKNIFANQGYQTYEKEGERYIWINAGSKIENK